MRIHDGGKKDISNFLSDKFLTVNSCGFQNATSEYMVIREKGRLDYHILLITSGTCNATFSGKEYVLSPGDVILYAPFEEQKYIFYEGASSMWCHFSGTAVAEILESCNLTSGVHRLPQNKEVCEAFSDIIRRFHHPQKKYFENASLIELICNISELKSRSGKSYEHNSVLSVLSYINENYNKKITLDQLAKISGYSKSRVSHMFSESTGTTPIRYQNDVRLENAREMLLSTSLSVTEISDNCGFYDSVYFSKIFKKKFGVSPTKYRNKQYECN